MAKLFVTTGLNLITSGGRAVVISQTTGTLVTAGAGQRSDGILEAGVGLGVLATVIVDGGQDAVSGASISKGDPVTSDSVGRIVPAVNGDFILGIALDTVIGAAQTVGVQVSQIGNRFGNDYLRVIVAGRSTTTSGTFQLKTTLVTPSGLFGLYLVEWRAVIDISGSTNSTEARLQNVTDAVTVGVPHEIVVSTGSSPNPIFAVGSRHEISMAGLSKTFELEFRNVSGGTSGCEQAWVDFKRVGG